MARDSRPCPRFLDIEIKDLRAYDVLEEGTKTVNRIDYFTTRIEVSRDVWADCIVNYLEIEHDSEHFLFTGRFRVIRGLPSPEMERRYRYCVECQRRLSDGHAADCPAAQSGRAE